LDKITDTFYASVLNRDLEAASGGLSVLPKICLENREWGVGSGELGAPFGD
jgi:hypothetical protein